MRCADVAGDAPCEGRLISPCGERPDQPDGGARRVGGDHGTIRWLHVPRGSWRVPATLAGRQAPRGLKLTRQSRRPPNRADRVLAILQMRDLPRKQVILSGSIDSANWGVR
jgi:hypothetical protein